MTPESIATAGTEEAEQTALFAWCGLHSTEYPELKLLFAIPNGGLRDKITASKLKAQGVKAGVFDIFLPVARGPWHGLFIEMKRRKTDRHPAGSMSPDQTEWMPKVKAQGYGAACCIGWESARDVLVAYLTYKI